MIDIALIYRASGASVSDPNNFEDLCQTGNVIDINASQSLGKTVGSMEINLGAISDYKDRFSMNDSFSLYASYNSLDRSDLSDMYTNNPTAFIFSGTLGSINFNWGEGKEVIELVCADKTAILTNIIAQRSYWLTSQGYAIARVGGDDSNSVIHQIVSEMNELMNSAQGTDVWQNVTISDSDIDDTTSYGNLDAAIVFKTYAEILEELADGAYTSNVRFTYWIDANNGFHWKKLGSTKDDDMVYGTDKINNIKFKREVYDTVNAAIINAGVDLNGVGIWWYTVNYASAAEVGFRWEILPETMFAKQFESILYDKGTATGVSGATLTDSTKDWTSNELQNMWLINPNRGNSANIASNTATVITADGEGWRKNDYYIYEGTNATFRASMKEKSIARANAELAKTSKLRYRGNITFEGDASRILNQVYEIEMDYFGFSSTAPLKMRLTDINHNFGDGSWKTQFTLKEDIGTEGEN